MSSPRVTFLPFEKTVEVKRGTTLMEAAQKSGVEIINLCGGNGVCGKCRVRVVDGHISADPLSLFAPPVTKVYIEISRYRPFMDEYVAAMFLPHADRRLFPSVTY